jgi:hypothetical protein
MFIPIIPSIHRYPRAPSGWPHSLQDTSRRKSQWLNRTWHPARLGKPLGDTSRDFDHQQWWFTLINDYYHQKEGPNITLASRHRQMHRQSKSMELLPFPQYHISPNGSNGPQQIHRILNMFSRGETMCRGLGSPPWAFVAPQLWGSIRVSDHLSSAVDQHDYGCLSVGK